MGARAITQTSAQCDQFWFTMAGQPALQERGFMSKELQKLLEGGSASTGLNQQGRMTGSTNPKRQQVFVVKLMGSVANINTSP